ncbi:hypothetical protein [Albimonas pacifica]|uniref:Uncharacterized protein n=1 Tax=Albimonas pacifica TaxID=1114924 RepID=A0A1I3JXV6_9RHOB|nr:hypothetical protein [Albimonas pacifica]SFI64785.1 hypothetical protein SAMN05216258_108197 [Albimonas pacifica]
MNDDEQAGRSHARPMARISTRDKRRNRRRKSKYNRPLLSLPHGMVALFLLLGVGFAFALAKGLMSGDTLTLNTPDTQRLSGVNLPGVAPQRAARPLGLPQILIWLYLFGTPILFAIQRAFMWRYTLTNAKYLMMSGLAVWVVVIAVVLVASV